MNYLSHYYADLSYHHPAFALGKVLPDFARIVDKRLRFRLKKLPDSGDEVLHLIHLGIRSHYRADAWFHNSEYFKTRTAEIQRILRGLRLEGIRKYYYFYAHILLEMLLDRLLVTEHFPVAQQFYADLDHCPEEWLVRYAGFHRLGSQTAEELAAVVSRFRHARYLFDYTRNEGLVFAFNRIIQRAGLPAFSEEDNARLAGSLQEMCDVAMQGFPTIFEHIRIYLANDA